MRSFDDIRKDPGQVYKERAEQTYARGKFIAWGVAIFGGLAGIAELIAFGENFFISVGLLCAIIAVTIVAILSLMESVFNAALHLYARGEELHLLRDIKWNTSQKDENGECIPESNSKEQATATIAQWAKNSAPVAKVAAKPATDEWKCVCGRVNKNYTRTCTCGASYRDRVK